MSFKIVSEFEQRIADFFGAPYGIAVDSCTHGIELCLRYKKADSLTCPTKTYISIPILANKLNLTLFWRDIFWKNYYTVNCSPDSIKTIDAAVLWEENSYIPNTFMCISFQYQKHLSLGRGGIILTDNEVSYTELKKLSYDGRILSIPWREQNIDTVGYHYYMTPETAKLGIEKLPEAIKHKPRIWTSEDYPNLCEMEVFKNKWN